MEVGGKKMIGGMDMKVGRNQDVLRKVFKVGGMEMTGEK